MKTLWTPNSLRVALVGSNHSGKTVFLTSLLANLIDHDPQTFYLCGWNVEEAGLAEEPMDGLPPFPYAKYRAELSAAEGHPAPEWPEKTYGVSLACLRLILNKRHHYLLRELEFLDLPGELVADFDMCNRSYEAWSRHLSPRLALAAPDAAARYAQAAKALLDAADRGRKAVVALRPALCDLYKQFVAVLYRANACAILTPSVLRAPLDGRSVGRTPDAYAATLPSLPCGLAGAEFCPLPDVLLDHPRAAPLVQAFADGYERYRRRLVLPVVSWLRHADVALYLVDVLTLLAGGTDAYNAELALAPAVLDVFRNRRFGHTFLGRQLARAIDALCLTHVSQLLLVAPKADLVPPDQRDHLVALARRLFRQKPYALNIPDVRALSCAAVLTTRPARERASGADRLHATFADGPRLAPPLQIPAEWPADDWPPGRYAYDESLPPFPRRLNQPPPQLGLDDIARLLLRLD